VDISAPVSSEREQQIIAMFNDPGNQTLTGRMGIKIVSAARDRVVGTMPVDGNTQPYGLLHGGASCVLAETLGSLGSALQAGPDRVTIGIEINATHHRAARTGLVTGIATLVHGGRTDLDDHALAVLHLAGDRLGFIETSWARPGGMNDLVEIVGDGGVAYVDLLRGSSIVAYSEEGYGYAVEKAGDTKGWSFAMFEESWNYGMPQEMQHFVDCLRTGSEPLETGADGRVALEVVYAAYLSAGRGERVNLPLQLSDEEAATAPYLLWKGRSATPT